MSDIIVVRGDPQNDRVVRVFIENHTFLYFFIFIVYVYKQLLPKETRFISLEKVTINIMKVSVYETLKITVHLNILNTNNIYCDIISK